MQDKACQKFKMKYELPNSYTKSELQDGHSGLNLGLGSLTPDVLYC